MIILYSRSQGIDDNKEGWFGQFMVNKDIKVDVDQYHHLRAKIRTLFQASPSYQIVVTKNKWSASAFDMSDPLSDASINEESDNTGSQL